MQFSQPLFTQRSHEGAYMDPKPLLLVASDATPMGSQLLSAALGASSINCKVAACVSRSSELVDSISKFTPDVALISANLEDGPLAGLSALREIHLRFPKMTCVVLMNTRARDLVIEAFRSGAKGVFFRDDSFDMLCRCIESVRNGQIWVGSKELNDLLEALSSAVPLRIVSATGDDLLSTRQKQLVALVTEGLTNREIAQQLHLSEHTVKNYMFRIFDKLGVSNRAELIIHALNQRDRAA